VSVQALIFDLDGTIANTSISYVKSIKHALEKFDIEFPGAEYVIERISHGSIGIIEELCGNNYSTAEKLAIRKEFLSYYEPISGVHVEAYGKIVPTLKVLNAQGVPLAIVTNKPQKLAFPALKALGLQNLFQIIICPEQVSHVKPSPEGLTNACEFLNVSPTDSVYCGDHSKDILTAKNAKTKSIAVSYGFKAKEDNANLWGADWVCNSAEEFCHLLLSLGERR
jgi:phosphoglycolate phosphatase